MTYDPKAHYEAVQTSIDDMFSDLEFPFWQEKDLEQISFKIPKKMLKFLTAMEYSSNVDRDIEQIFQEAVIQIAKRLDKNPDDDLYHCPTDEDLSHLNELD